MSFIDEKRQAYSERNSKYTLETTEKAVVDILVGQAKQCIELEINQGGNSVRQKYYYDEGNLSSYQMWKDETINEYMNSNLGTHSLSYLVPAAWCNDQEKIALHEAISRYEKSFNLSQMEREFCTKIKALGAKSVEARIEYRSSYTAHVYEKGFFRTHIVNEERPLGKYKICYIISW